MLGIAIGVVSLVSLHTPAGAQVVTLPTVRIGGPPEEERAFFRIVDEIRREFTPDTAAMDSEQRSRARDEIARVEVKLDSLLLAAINDDQGDELRQARSREDTLRALAYDKYDVDDPVVTRLYQALTTYGRAQREYNLSSRRASAPPAAAVIDTATVPPPALRERDARRLLRGARRDPTLPAARAAKIDSLTQLAVALIILRKFDERDGWFPVQSRPQAEVFWGQQGLAPLNVGAIAGSESGGVAFTEIAAPILHFLRVSVNAVIASSDSDEDGEQSGGGNGTGAPAPNNEAAVKRLTTGGGLVNLAFAYPIFHGSQMNGDAALTTLFVPRVGVTAPALGATAEDSATLALDSGLELHGKFLDLAGGVGLTGQFRWAYALGSRKFGDALGLASDHLTYATVAFGFVFGRQYMLTLSRPIAGPGPVRKTDWTIGVTAVRMPTF
jgi:hypothetical protein